MRSEHSATADEDVAIGAPPLCICLPLAKPDIKERLLKLIAIIDLFPCRGVHARE